MKKIIIGIVIGATVTSAVFYFIHKNKEAEKKDNVAALLDLIKQRQANDRQTNETINDPGSTLVVKNALSFLVSGSDDLYYYRNTDCSRMEKITFNAVSLLLKEEKKNNKPEDLMILIKSTRDATFQNSVNLLDAISMAAIPAGHFAEINISEKEKNCILNYKKD